MRRCWEAPLALVLCSLAELAVWRAARGDLRISPDAVEYLGVARSLARGHGLMLGIKGDFFNRLAPPFPAAAHLPVGYPLMLAGSGLAPLHFNLLAASLAAFLLFLAARREAGPAVAWSALILILTAPVLWDTAIYAWPDAAYLLLLSLAAWLLSAGRRPAVLVAVGGVLGLATMTRDEGVVGMAALAGALLAERGSARDFARAAVAFAAAAAPAAILAVAATGWPPQTSHLAHFRLTSMLEGINDGFGRSFPSPWQYVSSHARFVLGRIAVLESVGARNLVMHYLTLLSPGFVALLLPRRRPLPRALRWMLITGLLQFGAAHLLWSTTTPYDPKFYMVPVALLTAPLLGMAADLELPRPLPIALLSMMAAGTLLLVPVDARYLAFRWRGRTLTQVESRWPRVPVVVWLRAHARPGEVVACPWDPANTILDPWSLYQATHLPTVLEPNLLTPDDLRRFAQLFHVKYFLDRPFPVPWLKPLPVRGLWIAAQKESGPPRRTSRPPGAARRQPPRPTPFHQ